MHLLTAGAQQRRWLPLQIAVLSPLMASGHVQGTHTACLQKQSSTVALLSTTHLKLPSASVSA